jgi:hypothetical protein
VQVAFAGEGGDDYGGLFRESIRELAADLQGHALPLFVPAPNKCVVCPLVPSRWPLAPALHPPADTPPANSLITPHEPVARCLNPGFCSTPLSSRGCGFCSEQPEGCYIWNKAKPFNFQSQSFIIPGIIAQQLTWMSPCAEFVGGRWAGWGQPARGGRRGGVCAQLGLHIPPAPQAVPFHRQDYGRGAESPVEPIQSPYFCCYLWCR